MHGRARIGDLLGVPLPSENKIREGMARALPDTGPRGRSLPNSQDEAQLGDRVLRLRRSLRLFKAHRSKGSRSRIVSPEECERPRVVVKVVFIKGKA